MSDDQAGADVGRDEELGRSLAVSPLDEVTRRRLVQAALERTAAPPATRVVPRGRSLAIVGVAASLLVGVVVGAVVVTRPETPATPTAAGSAPEAAANKAAENDAAADTSAPAQSLGDLGAVADIAELARVVDVRLQLGRSGAGEDAVAAAVPCIGASGGDLVVVSAVGTATLDGRSVVVRVGPAPSGEILVAVLDATECVAISSTPLPPA